MRTSKAPLASGRVGHEGGHGVRDPGVEPGLRHHLPHGGLDAGRVHAGTERQNVGGKEIFRGGREVRFDRVVVQVGSLQEGYGLRGKHRFIRGNAQADGELVAAAGHVLPHFRRRRTQGFVEPLLRRHLDHPSHHVAVGDAQQDQGVAIQRSVRRKGLGVSGVVQRCRQQAIEEKVVRTRLFQTVGQVVRLKHRAAREGQRKLQHEQGDYERRHSKGEHSAK